MSDDTFDRLYQQDAGTESPGISSFDDDAFDRMYAQEPEHFPEPLPWKREEEAEAEPVGQVAPAVVDDPRAGEGTGLSHGLQAVPRVDAAAIPAPSSKEGVGSELTEQFKSGGLQLGKMLADTPGYLYDIASAPQNLLADQLDMPSLKTDRANLGKAVGVETNPVSEYYGKEIEASQKRIAKINPKYQQGIIESFSKGDIETGFRNLAGGILQSLQPSMAIMLSGGTMGTAGTIASGTALFGAGKKAEIDANAPDMPEWKRTVVATGNGLLEGLWETALGAGAVGKAFKNVITKSFKEGGEEAAKQSGKKFIGDMWVDVLEKTPALAPLGEGFEEFGTQISQNAVDKYSGYRPDIKLTDGAGDALLMGIGQGGLMSGGLYAAKALTTPKAPKPGPSNDPAVLEDITSGGPVDLLGTGGTHGAKTAPSGPVETFNPGPASGLQAEPIQTVPFGTPEDAPVQEAVVPPAPAQPAVVNPVPVSQETVAPEQPVPEQVAPEEVQPVDYSGLEPEEIAGSFNFDDMAANDPDVENMVPVAPVQETPAHASASAFDEDMNRALKGEDLVSLRRKYGVDVIYVVRKRDQAGVPWRGMESSVMDEAKQRERVRLEKNSAELANQEKDDSLFSDSQKDAMDTERKVSEEWFDAHKKTLLGFKNGDVISHDGQARFVFRDGILFTADSDGVATKPYGKIGRDTTDAGMRSVLLGLTDGFYQKEGISALPAHAPVQEQQKPQAQHPDIGRFVRSGSMTGQIVDVLDDGRLVVGGGSVITPGAAPNFAIQDEDFVRPTPTQESQGQEPSAQEPVAHPVHASPAVVDVAGVVDDVDTAPMEAQKKDPGVKVKSNGDFYTKGGAQIAARGKSQDRSLGGKTYEPVKLKGGWGIRVVQPVAEAEAVPGAKPGKPVTQEEPVVTPEPHAKPVMRDETASEPAQKDEAPAVGIIGVNAKGNRIERDKNGVRGEVTPAGIVIQQKVRMTPHGSSFDSPEALYENGDLRFLTKKEINAFGGNDQETEAVAEPSVSTKETVAAADATAEDMLAEWDRQEAEEKADKKVSAPDNEGRTPGGQDQDNVPLSLNNTPDTGGGQKADKKMSPPDNTLENHISEPGEKVASAKDHLKAAADLMSQVNDILAGSVGLSVKVVKEGDNVDAGVYEQIKPLLQQAFGHIVAAGKDMAEYVSMARKMLKGPNGRAYFKKFVTNDLVKQAKGDEDDHTVSGTGVQKYGKPLRDDKGRTGGRGNAAPAAVETEGVRKPAKGKDAQDDRGGKGKDGAQGNKRPYGKGISKPRSRRNSSPEVRPAEAGAIAKDDIEATEVPGANFRITDEVALGEGSEAVKYRDNIAAIKTLKLLESEHRGATPDEQRILARYVGWGGLANAFQVSGTGRIANGWEDRVHEVEELLTGDELKAARNSTKAAYYTSADVVRAMWDAVKRMGFTSGIVLEPSVGTGNFLGLVPDALSGNVHFLGAEYDAITARIAKKLYPQSAIFHTGFEKLPIPSGSVDLVIGNPPFGQDRLRFPFNPDLNPYTIHNQFFLAGLDALAPGGVEIMVVSRHMLDASDGSVRKAIARKAHLLGAVRLPETAFKKNAGTEVVTDIVVLQRYTKAEQMGVDKRIADGDMPSPRWVDTSLVSDPLGGESMRVNSYFADTPSAILGTMDRSGSMQRGADITVKYSGDDYVGDLNRILKDVLPSDVMDATDMTAKRTEDMYARLVDSLAIHIQGAERGSVTLNSQGEMVQVYERETGTGDYIMARRVITPESAWSDKVTMDKNGRWFRTVDEMGPDGKPVKVGKKKNRNKKIREVFQSEADLPASLRLGDLGYDRLKRAVVMRDCLIEQLNLESAKEPDEKGMAANRKKLNTLYDAYVEKHGCLNGAKTASLVRELPNSALILSLEKRYIKPINKARSEKTGLPMAKERAEKADVFTQRVVPVYAPPEHAENDQDALAISLSEYGKVHLDRIAALLGIDEAEAVKRLHTDMEKPMIFKDPETGTWETSDEYLGGNVVRKLEAAKSAGETKNIHALEAIQPEAWTADQVTPIMGAAWIDPKDYAGFVEHLTGDSAKVLFAPLTNTYAVYGKGDTPGGQLWKTDRMNAVKLVDALLNSRTIKVRDSWKDESGSHSVVNVAETEAAVAKASEIVQEFESWIFADADRRERLVSAFNRKYNVMVNKQRDGQHLTLPGKVPDAVIKMRRHQLNAIWRGICDRNVLYDHAVGAGKTYTGISRAIERKRMGLSNKPMIVVPNHMVEQFAKDAYRLYPGVKVLAAGKKDFNKGRRRRLFASIATGDWDLIIVPHSSFGFIGISPATEERFLEEELANAEAAIADAQKEAEENNEGGRFKPVTVKQAERLRDTIKARLDKAREKQSGKDRLLTFEQMGIDDLTIDEAHEFKNLFYYSNLNVRGMNPKAGSGKAYDLFNKIRILRESKKGSLCFMTGTPISNSAVELYGLMRYLAQDSLEEMGLAHFDAWRSQFATVTTQFEPTESGSGLKEVDRLGRDWSNMRSLMDMYYSFADCVSNEDIQKWYLKDKGEDYPIPKVKGGGRKAINVHPTPAQKTIITEIIDGFNGLPGITDIKERNSARLRLMDKARKVSLDARAAGADPRTTDEKGGKLDVAAGEIARVYKKWNEDKGTQVVFLDRSVIKSKGDKKRLQDYDALVRQIEKAEADGDETSLGRLYDRMDKYDSAEMEELRQAQAGGWNGYDQLKQNLIDRGVPAKEIRFVQEANTDDQKQALFDDVNDGIVRVLIGSTARMGAGTNMQKRLVGLHHVDVTWKPSDIEQREGRIIRTGNELLEKYGDDFEVEILAYTTDTTVDAKLWSLNATKLKMINGIRHYEGAFNMEFDDADSVGMAEIAAIASGEPLQLERIKLSAEIDRLDRAKRSYRRRLWGIEDEVKKAKSNIKDLPGRIEAFSEAGKDVAAALEREDKDEQNRHVTIDGVDVYRGDSGLIDAERMRDLVRGSISEDALSNLKADMEKDTGGHRRSRVSDILEAIADRSADAKKNKQRFSIEIDGQVFKSKVKASEYVESVLGASGFDIELGGERFLLPKLSMRKLADMVNAVVPGGFKEIEETAVGTAIVHGRRVDISVSVEKEPWGKDPGMQAYLYFESPIGKYNIYDTEMFGLDPQGKMYPGMVNMFRGVGRSVKGIAETADTYAHDLQISKDALPELEEHAGKPFPKEDELKEKKDRLNQVEQELVANAEKKKVAGDEGETEAAPEAPKYLNGDGEYNPGQDNGVTVTEAEDHIDLVRPLLASDVVIRTVKGIYGLPEAVWRHMEKNDAMASPGVFYEGVIYIVSNNLQGLDQLTDVVLGHELTHAGLAKLRARVKAMGGKARKSAMDVDRVLRQVWMANQHTIAAMARNGGQYEGLFDIHTDEGRLGITEEWLANHGKETRFYDKWVAAIRRFLRAVGEHLGVEMEFSEAEVRDLLGQVGKAVTRKGEIEYLEGLPKYQAVYHGTPHRGIEKFDTKHRGTGEGGLKPGVDNSKFNDKIAWGLYFAGKKAVAEWYRSKLAPTRLTIGDIKENTEAYSKAIRKRLEELSAEREAAHEGFNQEMEALYENGRPKLREKLDLLKKWDGSHSRPDADETILAEIVKNIDNGSDILDAIDRVKGRDHYFSNLNVYSRPASFLNDLESRAGVDFGVLSQVGQLYKVEIPEDDEMLDWDKPLNDQSGNVDEKLQEVPQDIFTRPATRSVQSQPGGRRRGKIQLDPRGDLSGMEFYREVAKATGSEKAASEYLGSIGIKGIKYLDGSSRGAGEGTYNYVIFDGADTEISDVFYSRAKKKTDSATSQTRTTSLFPEVQERLDAARGIKPLSWMEGIKKGLTTAKHLASRHFIHLSPRRFGDAISILREAEAIPTASQQWAADRLREVLGGLSKDEYEVFTMNIILPDQIKDVESGLRDEDGLSWGYNSLEEMQEDLEHFKEAASQKVKDALFMREQTMGSLRKDLVKHKILSKEILKDPRYFHHQVMDYMTADQYAGTGSSDSRIHWKGWKSARNGSALDYNTDYLQAEYEVLAQGKADVMRAEALKLLRKSADVIATLKKMAKDTNLAEFYAEANIMPDQINTKADPLNQYRQKMAMGFGGLTKAAEKGELFAPPEFEGVLEALADAKHDQTEADMVEAGITVQVRHPMLWSYLAYLAQRGDMEGSMNARMILKAVHDREARIKATLGKAYQTFRDRIPSGMVAWSPAVKSPMFKAPTISEKIMQAVMEGGKVEIGKGDITEMWVRGQKELWVIPQELAAQLDEATDTDSSSMGKLDRRIMNMWKQWTLLNPFRVLKYNLNNTSGDADIAMAYDPRILKGVGSAAKDLYAWMRKSDLPAQVRREMEDAVTRDVVGSGLTIQEVPDITARMSEDRLLGDLLQVQPPDALVSKVWQPTRNAVSKIWRTTKDYTTWRENILRLAAYRYFKERLHNGETGIYGASIPAHIDAITDIDRKAATLARELIGDYGNLTQAGIFIRRHLIPFYSWMEINMPRYARMMRNLKMEGREGNVGKIAGWKIAKGGGKLALKAFILYGAVQLWNSMFFPDEDDKLNRSGRNQIHIILGRRDDGSIRTIRFQGALSDALSWFGLENPVATLRQLYSGKMDVQDLGEEMLKAPFNKAVLSARPFVRTTGEVLAGTQLYPDITRPRAIRDKMEHIARTFSLDKVTGWISGKPKRGGSTWGQVAQDVESLLTYTTDPGENAYWDVRSDMYKWMRRNNIETGRTVPTSRGNALYWYKQSLRYGDLRGAEKYLRRYKELGGTERSKRQSIRMADPRRTAPGMSRKYFSQYKRQMSPADKKRMEQAVTWYKNVYRAGEKKR